MRSPPYRRRTRVRLRRSVARIPTGAHPGEYNDRDYRNDGRTMSTVTRRQAIGAIGVAAVAAGVSRLDADHP